MGYVQRWGIKTLTMKTAIQLAIESYKNDGVSFTDWFIENYEMLLEKEKEQIIVAFIHNRYVLAGGHPIRRDYAEEYYNKTYNQNK